MALAHHHNPAVAGSARACARAPRTCATNRARPRRAAVAVAASAAAPDIIGLSALRLAKPPAAEMEKLATGYARSAFNNASVGATQRAAPHAPGAAPPPAPAPGFFITADAQRVGTGKAAYDAAVAAVRSFAHLQLGWNATTAPAMAEGATICSATRTLVPWLVLPARVKYLQEAELPGGGRRFVVGLASLSGHLLAGEERFTVELAPGGGDVSYGVFLMSKPATLLAWASLPVMLPLQRLYVGDSIKAVAAAVGGGGGAAAVRR